jgi:hypothetical protein
MAVQTSKSESSVGRGADDDQSLAAGADPGQKPAPVEIVRQTFQDFHIVFLIDQITREIEKIQRWEERGSQRKQLAEASHRILVGDISRRIRRVDHHYFREHYPFPPWKALKRSRIRPVLPPMS